MPEKKVRVVIYVPESRHDWIIKHFCDRQIKRFGEIVDVGKTPSEAYLHLISLAIESLEDEDG
jgi:hypothetical protein